MNSINSIVIKYFRFLYPLLLLLGAGWVWVSRLPSDSVVPVLPSPAKGFSAPDFRLLDSDGNSYQLSNLRGQVVLLNFWASWCPPCRAEMPDMQAVYETYKDDGFVILSVNSTIQDDRSAAVQFYQQHNLTFPLLFDEDGSVTESYQIRSLPTSFFIDASGIIREVVIGGPMAEALMISRVENLFKLQPLPQP